MFSLAQACFCLFLLGDIGDGIDHIDEGAIFIKDRGGPSQGPKVFLALRMRVAADQLNFPLLLQRPPDRTVLRGKGVPIFVHNGIVVIKALAHQRQILFLKQLLNRVKAQ